MSRTIKKYPAGYFRSPKGYKQARIAGARPSAVPPTSWDDISADKQCWLPCRVAEGMIKKFQPWGKIVDHLRRRFGLRTEDARQITEMMWNRRPKVPEGLLTTYKERKLGCSVKAAHGSLKARDLSSILSTPAN